MPSKTRIKRASIRTPASAPAAPHQKRFPARVRSLNKDTSTPASGLQIQQTLTQIDFVPRSEQPDEDGELQYLSFPKARRKRRKTTQERADEEQDSTLTQINFITRCVPSKDNGTSPPPSAQPRRKYRKAIEKEAMGDQISTLTQVDFVSKRLERGSSEGLQFVADGQGAFSEHIQKTSLKDETASARGTHKQTSRARQRGVFAESLRGNRASSPVWVSQQAMAPPRTPKKLIKTEIPSSQSPDRSISSIRSQRFAHDPSISPLKERSTNTPSKLRYSERAPLLESILTKNPKLEIEDAPGLENFSQIPTQPTHIPPRRNSSKITKLEIEDSDEDDSDNYYEEKSQIQTPNEENQQTALPGYITAALLPLTATDSSPSLPSTESQQASAQLHSDLSLSTQQPVLIVNDNSYDNSSQQGHTRQPSRLSPGGELPTVPVRFSQATTVDLTQISPPLLRSSQPTLPASFVAPQYTCSARTQGKKVQYNDHISHLALSSSPLADRGNPAGQVVWDGRPMTDSQMLPDSIMNFQLPPMCTQDSVSPET